MHRAGIIATVLFLTTSSALAHSPLKSTVPIDGASVAGPVETVTLNFAKPARVTKLVVTQPSGDALRLDVPVADFVQEMEVETTLDQAGPYELDWRALSDDGHPIKGTIRFTLK